MKDIVCVKLENEMDLILAHKRAMKICELTGFSIIAQTSIATAVSEVSRCAIDFGKNAELHLGIDTLGGKKFLKAIICDSTDFTPRCAEACVYAKRLVDDIEITRSAKEIQITLKHQLSFAGTLTDAKLESFVEYFRQEPPLSAYDELRRKNMMLYDLSEKLKESENDYKFLTDTLPLMMFSATNRGAITYTNKWLQDFLGSVPKELNNSWQAFMHPDDFNSFNKDLNASLLRQVPLKGQYRFKESTTGNFLWHLVSITPVKNEKKIITQWMGFLVDINAQKMIEQTLKDNRELKETQDLLYQNQSELQQKVIELNRSNYELEQFAHLASHDLQEPLRKLFFYSDVLKNKHSANLEPGAITILNNMALAAGRMKELISDLLSYSQLQKQFLQFEPVNLNDIIHEVIRDLDITIKEKSAFVEADDLPVIQGNPLRLRQLFANLISNALKYSKAGVAPVIQILVSYDDTHVSIKVKDNGIGFEEQYKERIFGLFERLHTRDQFPGTGIGLSICKRIAELHHGTISAESEPGQYSIFEVKLPAKQEANPIHA